MPNIGPMQDFQKPFLLMVDTSDIGDGAVLMQSDDKDIDDPIFISCVILFTSKELYTPMKKGVRL